jgi:UDP-glucose 4-epimerase
VPPDLRDLNYAKYVDEGQNDLSKVEDYNSHNTERLDVAGMQKLLMKLTFMPAIQRGENIAAEE